MNAPRNGNGRQNWKGTRAMQKLRRRRALQMSRKSAETNRQDGGHDRTNHLLVFAAAGLPSEESTNVEPVLELNAAVRSGSCKMRGPKKPMPVSSRATAPHTGESNRANRTTVDRAKGTLLFDGSFSGVPRLFRV